MYRLELHIFGSWKSGFCPPWSRTTADVLTGTECFSAELSGLKMFSCLRLMYFHQFIVGRKNEISAHMFVLWITWINRIGCFVDWCCLNATESLVSLVGFAFWITVLAEGCYYFRENKRGQINRGVLASQLCTQKKGCLLHNVGGLSSFWLCVSWWNKTRNYLTGTLFLRHS